MYIYIIYRYICILILVLIILIASSARELEEGQALMGQLRKHQEGGGLLVLVIEVIYYSQ